MQQPAVPDIVTVIGSDYFQPIANLVECCSRRHNRRRAVSAHSCGRENGYAASIIILLVAVLESYQHVFVFCEMTIPASKNVPNFLADLFPDLPQRQELIEVFVLRNLVVHNHIWHLDVSDPEGRGAQTLASPLDLGFDVNQHYRSVDPNTRRTRLLGLNASPTAVDRGDVKRVFGVV